MSPQSMRSLSNTLTTASGRFSVADTSATDNGRRDIFII